MTGGHPPVKRWLFRTGLPVAIGVAAVGAAAYAVSTRWRELHDAVGHFGAVAVVGSFILGAGGVYFPFLVWRTVLAGLATAPSMRMSSRLFFTSQLGKYLPGSVWPLLAQMEFGRRAGISRRSMLAANLITVAFTLAIGLVVAGVCLPFSSASALGRFWWTFLALPPLLALIHPRAIPAIIDFGFRLARRPPLDERLPLRATLRASVWALASWLCFGMHIYLLTRTMGAHGASAPLAAIGGVALAMSAGIIFIPAPAGAGVRDAILIAALAPGIGDTPALAVALTSRVLLIVADVAFAALFGLARSKSAPFETVEAAPSSASGTPTEVPDA